jgi:hypothetical protein
MVILVLLLFVGGSWGWSAPAGATEGPTVTGSVQGGTSVGDRLVIQVDATEPGGWRNLDRLDLDLLTGGTADRLSYDVRNQRLALNQVSFVVQTGASARGNHLALDGATVVVTAGGADLALKIPTEVIATIPADARFRLRATDQLGRSGSVTLGVSAPPSGGVTWSTVAGLLLLALLVGGFVGNVTSSSRRSAPRFSVYGTIRGKIERERRSAGVS